MEDQQTGNLLVSAQPQQNTEQVPFPAWVISGVAGLSQLQVARDAGLNDSYLSKIIQGWVDPPKEIKTRLANVLSCDLDQIFPETRRDL